MNLRETLALPSFAGATVVGDDALLEREVTGAMVLEASDISSWGRRGQLLVTSFYALQNLGPSELAGFFAEAERIGIAGIVFKPERLVVYAPKTIVGHCVEHHIPLITVTPQTRYEAILADVLGHILDSNLTLLSRFFDVHRQMMTLALRQPSVSEIMLRLRAIIHANCTYYAPASETRISTTDEFSGFSKVSLTELARDRYRTFSYFDATLAFADGAERQATAVRVPSADDSDHYLIIHTTSERLRSLDIMAVENVVSLLQMEVLKQQAIDQQLFFRNNGLVHDLLHSPDQTPEHVDATLRELGIGEEPLFRVLLLRVNLAEVREAPRAGEVLLALRRRIKMLYPDVVYHESGSQLFLVRNYGSGDGFDLADIRHAAEELQAIPTLPRFSYLCALSEQGGRLELPRLTRQANDIARLFGGRDGTGEDAGGHDGSRGNGDASGRGGSAGGRGERHEAENICARYDDLGVYKVLMQVEDPSSLESLCDPRALALHRERPEFFETLLALCESSLNFQEAAKRLYIHPKTVRYRVERAEAQSGLDIHDPEDRMQIMLAAKVFALTDGRA